MMTHTCDFSAASVPYCGTYLFSFNNGEVYTHLGCSDIPYTSIATQVEAFQTPARSTTLDRPTTAAAATTTIGQSTAVAPQSTVVDAGTPPGQTTPSATAPGVVGIQASPTTQTTAATQTRNIAVTAGGAITGVLGSLAIVVGEMAMYLF